MQPIPPPGVGPTVGVGVKRGRTDVFDWIVNMVEQTGYVGVALLMFAENLFPPIPSELILPLAGFTAARGELGLVMVIVSGTGGAVLGALFWYLIGRGVGCRRLKRWAGRHGRWLTIAPEEVDQAATRFREHGGRSVLIGRMIPAVRTLISIPAGVSEMALAPFLLYTTVGTAIWTTFLATAGYLLEDRYQQVAGWLNPVSNIVAAGIALWYVYRVATFGRRTSGQPAE
ncbi:membrane protein DedA, SNARE-associated domain [Azospirillum oryzae]|uniref:Membrane protein DedA, SNARE-associated domain n=1 Tax=Azospirillum oryzae TaxID=286727 RepID=A0A1X7HSY0_9PROT|nr:membrane protein DedA, SNARE-associated domain [Azospirillum oryzae]